MTGECDILRRAYDLFAGQATHPSLGVPPDPAAVPMRQVGEMAGAYHGALTDWQAQLRTARDVDERLVGILAETHRDHTDARRTTGAVLTAARADAGTLPDNPIAAGELLRRRVIRLRAQQSHVRTARARAHQRRSALRSLRYRSRRRTRGEAPAARAVRAALSKIGRPYVWGASGPDRFDCSGLVQWAYGQAGVRLHRTTYEQIHDGVPVARSQVRPGDLVFPHTGHVQLAIGNGLVVEAPQPGASVQISRMGHAVAIRRPA